MTNDPRSSAGLGRGRRDSSVFLCGKGHRRTRNSNRNRITNRRCVGRASDVQFHRGDQKNEKTDTFAFCLIYYTSRGSLSVPVLALKHYSSDFIVVFFFTNGFHLELSNKVNISICEIIQVSKHVYEMYIKISGLQNHTLDYFGISWKKIQIKEVRMHWKWSKSDFGHGPGENDCMTKCTMPVH